MIYFRIFKNQTIKAGDKYEISNNTLIIYNPTIKEDAGTYTCKTESEKLDIYFYCKYISLLATTWPADS